MQETWRCRICPFCIPPTLKQLLEHLGRIHSEDFPLKCVVDGCNRNFKTHATLYNHCCYDHHVQFIDAANDNPQEQDVHIFEAPENQGDAVDPNTDLLNRNGQQLNMEMDVVDIVNNDNLRERMAQRVTKMRRRFKLTRVKITYLL